MTLDYRRWMEDEAELARREQQRELDERFCPIQHWEFVTDDAKRACSDLAGRPVPQEDEGSGEDETDPVDAADRWLWATAAWWKLDPAKVRTIAATQGLDAALKYAEPVTQAVNEKAFQKRFENWVAKGCPQPKGDQ